jgi:hypothetical protein
MKKMQCPVLKIIPVLFLLVFSAFSSAFSQILTYRLQKADSLFNAKQFTQSLAHYQEIFKQNEYTPAMFLKMAFVEEGLNHIGEALYYLNLYHLATGDDAVFEKMEQLSAKYKLAGYTLDETGQAIFLYQKHHDKISLGLAVTMLFLLSLGVYRKRKKRHSLPVVITMLVFTALFATHLALKETDTVVIVAGENNFLMAGPSGAAPVVDVISGGHRFEIEKRYDVWVQVRWKGRTAFIKEHQVLPVQL